MQTQDAAAAAAFQGFVSQEPQVNQTNTGLRVSRSEWQSEEKKNRVRERFGRSEPTNTIQLISFHFLPQRYHLTLPAFTTKKGRAADP